MRDIINPLAVTLSFLVKTEEYPKDFHAYKAVLVTPCF